MPVELSAAQVRFVSALERYALDAEPDPARLADLAAEAGPQPGWVEESLRGIDSSLHLHATAASGMLPSEPAVSDVELQLFGTLPEHEGVAHSCREYPLGFMDNIKLLDT